MCQTCLAEYHDPTDRRFHAQPNACSKWDPVSLVQSGGSFSDIKFATGASSLSILAQVRGLLHEGQIIAIRGMGGFHLACDVPGCMALSRLRQRKRRSDKPFAVMVPDIGVAEALCTVTPGDREALLVFNGPSLFCVAVQKPHPGRDRSRQQHLGCDVALYPASLPYFRRIARRSRVPCAGDDQRQPQRGANRYPK